MITNERKGGNDYKKICDRTCDECLKTETVDAYWAKKTKAGRGNIDLCLSCSNTRKYKKPIYGRQNKNWKHGLNSCGYRLLTTTDGRKCLEHQWIYEQFIGRRLQKPEIIHHINMDKTDNALSNLFLFPNRKFHAEAHTSMETAALTFLGQHLWFNRNNNQYTFEPQSQIVFQGIELIKHKIKEFRSGVNSYIIRYKNKPPYMRMTWKQNGRWLNKDEHVIVSEIILGRNLFYNEVVHHIDRDTLNNHPENLCIMTKSEHSICHWGLQKLGVSLMKNGEIIFNHHNGNYSCVNATNYINQIL